MDRRKTPSRSLDPQRSAPPGYVTAAQLAAIYKRSLAACRFRMLYDHVPSLRVEPRDSAGVRLRGRAILVFEQSAAHAAMKRPKRIARTSLPGYIGVLANAYNLTRPQVRDILAAAGVEAQQRICPCCCKSTLYYTDRTAAHAALSAAMHRYPLPPQ